MKAIVVDFDGDYIIVANSRGDFKRIYNNYPGCQIGDEITIKENRNAFFGSVLSSKKILALAACFLLMIITGYGIYDYVNPVTYVTVDINPSVEFSLNKYDVVREARGLNEEGKRIIGDGSEYRNVKFDKALKLVLSKAVEEDFLNEDTNTVMLTVSNVNNSISSDKKKELEEIAKIQLSNVVEKEEKTPSKQQKPQTLAENSHADVSSVDVKGTGKAKFKIIVEDTTYEKHKEATKNEVSQGKLLLYEKLKQVKPDAALNHVKEASVSQILREIEKEKKELKDKSKAQTKSKSDDKEKQAKEDKKQQLKDTKKLESNINKHIQKESNKQIKEKLKETREQLKNSRKELKENITKENKKESKNKTDINKPGQDKDNTPDKGNNKNLLLKNRVKTINRNKNNKN